MPTVRSAVLLSLAFCAEGKVTLAEDLGLLQGMHLNDLKGQSDSLGMLTMEESSTAKKSNLLRTAEALENLVRRVAMDKQLPDGAVKQAIEALKTTLKSYHDDLKGQIATANTELAGKATTHNECHTSSAFSVDTSDVTAKQSELDAAHDTWNNAKTDLTTKTGVLNTFVATITTADSCVAPTGTDDNAVQQYFTHLEQVVAKKAEYEAKKTDESNAASDEGLKKAAVVSARGSRHNAVCAARSAHHQRCHDYGKCLMDARTAHTDKVTTVTALSAALTSEAAVIKKSMCYVNLLLNHTGSVIDITSCSTGADGELSQAEKDELKLNAGPALEAVKPCTGLTDVIQLDPCATPAELSNAFPWDASCTACAALADTNPITINGDDVTLP